MSDEPKKNPSNVPGRYYVTDDCLACEACQDAAPNNFRYDTNIESYVFKQPGTPEEEEQCRRALSECPMGAIRDDGET
jgi:ferredoxin